MRDFKAYVRSRLGSSGLSAEAEIKVVEELAGQLEDLYLTLLERGGAESDAWEQVQREVPDWQRLRTDLAESARLAERLANLSTAPRVRAAFAHGVWQDLKFALRRARKDRGFVLTVLLTLAVCLGANAAIFTIVYAVLLKPIPLPDAERIVAFADQFPTADPNFSLLNNARSYFDRPGGVPAVEDQAMFRTTRRAIESEGHAEQIAGLEVTASFFTLLRTAPALGRPFTDADSETGNEQKIILSHGLWQQSYAGDPAVLGRELELDGRRFTIVGVMPPRFSFFRPDVRFWLPLTFTQAQRVEDTAATRLTYGWYHVGRLRAHETVAQAQTQVDALNAANLAAFPDVGRIWSNTRFHTIVVPLQEALVRDVSGILYLLWGGAAFVLVIGAINIANLTLARSSVRARELATRLAIGASAARLVRLLALESVLLAAAGGMLGLGIGTVLVHALQSHGLESMPNVELIGMDATVVASTLAGALFVGALIGLGSAAALRSPSLTHTLGAEGKGGTRGRGARTLRRGLVVAQIAISVVLLAGASLLLTSFRNLLHADPGFDGTSVVTAAFTLPQQTYADDVAVRAFAERVLGTIRALPGVETAGLTSNIPMGTGGGWGPIIADDYEAAPGESVVSPWRVVITPGYLETMGTPLVRGRAFLESDHADAEHVMLIDESLAKRFWGDANPIGARMYRPTYPDDLNRTDEKTQFYTVVGIVRDVQLRDLAGRHARAFGSFYLPQAQWPERNNYIAIKTRGSPDAVMTAARAEFARLDPRLPLFDVRTMTERTDLSLGSRKLALGLAGTFGMVALLLAALGIYGVLAYLVAQRRREIGIRIALGSSSRAVFRLVLGEGLWLTIAGLLLGTTGALMLTDRLEGELFGISPSDPIVLAAVALATGAIALLACLSPALRATRVDPLEVLADS